MIFDFLASENWDQIYIPYFSMCGYAHPTCLNITGHDLKHAILHACAHLSQSSTSLIYWTAEESSFDLFISVHAEVAQQLENFWSTPVPHESFISAIEFAGPPEKRKYLKQVNWRNLASEWWVLQPTADAISSALKIFHPVMWSKLVVPCKRTDPKLNIRYCIDRFVDPNIETRLNHWKMHSESSASPSIPSDVFLHIAIPLRPLAFQT